MAGSRIGPGNAVLFQERVETGAAQPRDLAGPLYVAVGDAHQILEVLGLPVGDQLLAVVFQGGRVFGGSGCSGREGGSSGTTCF